MERDGFICQSCGDETNTLNVHHKYYIKDKKPWEYPDNLLITLCEICHECEESCKYIITDFTKVLLAYGYTCNSLTDLLDWLRKLPTNTQGISLIINTVRKYETHQIKRSQK